MVRRRAHDAKLTALWTVLVRKRARSEWRRSPRPSDEPAGPAGKRYTWNIYHIKGTPAALLGRVEAPDEETAIRKAIDEFGINPALQKRLLAQRP